MITIYPMQAHYLAWTWDKSRCHRDFRPANLAPAAFRAHAAAEPEVRHSNACLDEPFLQKRDK